MFQSGFRGKQKDRLNQRHGTGLGLGVAAKILKAHSATAILDFDKLDGGEELGGVGNRFYFEMPYLTGQNSRICGIKSLGVVPIANKVSCCSVCLPGGRQPNKSINSFSSFI